MTSQTKSKSKFTSFNETLPSKEEKQGLQNIINSPHWARRKAKDEFALQFKRPIEEIEQYVRSSGKYWSKEKGKTILSPELETNIPKTIVKKETDKEESVSEEPRGNMVYQEINMPTGTELRIPFKKLRIEGNSLIFEF